jgi:DNA-directed RNA polymerase specialized sigma24 family protein
MATRDDRHGSAVLARAVVAAASGDRDARRYLYARYADQVHALVASAVRDVREADALTQQLFADLFGALHEDVLRVPFAPWLADLRVAAVVA